MPTRVMNEPIDINVEPGMEPEEKDMEVCVRSREGDDDERVRSQELVFSVVKYFEDWRPLEKVQRRAWKNDEEVCGR